MRAIKQKLSSQRGASLTFALLIFLVCAVVGSVVLAAGTAASGRMSKVAETDQRYYSVSSAAKLLIDSIGGETVTIIETKPKAGGESQFTDKDGHVIDPDSFDSISKEAAWFYVKHVVPSGASTRKGDTRYELALSVGDKSGLNVELKEEIKDDGSMVLTVGNAVSDATKDAYAMELTFSPDIKKTVDEQDKQTVTTWKIGWSIQNIKIVGGSMRVRKG